MKAYVLTTGFLFGLLTLAHLWRIIEEGPALLGSAWDGFSVHPNSFHDAGHSVIVEARYSGKYKATGKSMDTQVCHVWDVKDGKVTRFQQYVDTAKLQDVMKAR